MPNYADPGELQTFAAIPAGDTRDSIHLATALDAAERQIERHCGRVFTSDAAASARRYAVSDVFCAEVDDFHTTDDLEVKVDTNADGVFDVTWTAADYELDPIDGIRNGLTGWPYLRIHAVRGLLFRVPEPGARRRNRLEVTAKWGWAAVPDEVKTATLLQAHRLWKRKDSPEGVAGWAEYGVLRHMPHLDPDARILLRPFVKHPALVG